MGLVSKNKYSNNSRVLQSRNSENAIVFKNPDIIISFSINSSNRTTTADLSITFDVTFDWIVGNFNIGANANLFKKVTLSNNITKATKINSDNNGAGNGTIYEEFLNNNIFLPSVSSIKGITISQINGSGITGLELNLVSNFPLLSSYSVTIAQQPNFLFLESVPQIKKLSFQTNAGAVSNGNSLKNSNVVYLSFVGYNPTTTTANFINYLPNNLFYLAITQLNSMTLDLKDYFTGNRIGLSLGTAQSVAYLVYTGGAVFPSVIAPREFDIDYIIYQGNIYGKLTGDQLSRFLVDFANQVTAVTLPVGQRRMRFQGSSPNTSYTDATQPLFTTYSSALNHITSTLGITVSFT